MSVEITFRRNEGVPVGKIKKFAHVAEVSRNSINKIRRVMELPPVNMPLKRIRVIEEGTWKPRVAASSNKHIQNSVGMYETAQHACFIASDMERSQTAKILTHEAVHFASRGGLHEYSFTLNEGITEKYAQQIWNESVGPQCFDQAIDPYPTYRMETRLWSLIRFQRGDVRKKLTKAFWRNDSDQARQIVQQYFGRTVADSLEGEHKDEIDILLAISRIQHTGNSGRVINKWMQINRLEERVYGPSLIQQAIEKLKKVIDNQSQ